MSDLVIFHKQLGDTVLLEPVLRKIAHAMGEPVHLLCPPAFAPVIDLMPHTRMAFAHGRWFPDRVWAYDWGGRTTRAALATFFCREKHLLIPNPTWLTKLHHFTFSHIQFERYEDRYISHYFWDHTAEEATGITFSPATLERPPESWRPEFASDSPYFLLNPVSAWKSKCYTPEKWVEALSSLPTAQRHPILISGGTDDWQKAHCAQIATLAAKEGLQVTDISGQTSLQQFMWIISRATAVFCVDGAAAHLARGFNTPCLTLFGPSYRYLWHLETPHHLSLDASAYTDTPRPDASLIPAEAVSEALLRLLR